MYKSKYDRHIKTSAHKQNALVLHSFDVEEQLDEVITDEQPGLSVHNSPNQDRFEVDEHHSDRAVSTLAKGHYTIVTESPTGISTTWLQYVTVVKVRVKTTMKVCLQILVLSKRKVCINCSLYNYI